MADKQISSLPAATSVDDNSLFVVEQQGQAMSASGALWKGFAVDTVQPYVTQAQQSATQAAASASAAAGSASSAAESVQQIGTAVEDSQAAALTAEAAQEAAEAAQTAAESAQSAAAASAQSASTAAGAASTSASAAQSAQMAAGSAQSAAETAASTAQSAATQAGSSATAAQSNAESASESATQAQQSATAAQSSASGAATSAIAASEAQQAIENMIVDAITLETGQPASVTKSLVDEVVKLTFGLPRGEQGDTGDTGPQGVSIVSIELTSGNHAPGTTDTYTITLSNDTTFQFSVYNGANGTGTGDFMANGVVPMTGNLQMGGNKITNLGAPGADTDAVRKQDLDAVADEVDKILDGTTPAHIPPATAVKIGGVIVGDGLSVEADGTVSADSQLPMGGTTGQILTKTASGEAWQDAPSGLPDGGTTGQILTQGANGPEWADAPDTGVTTFNNRTGAVMPSEDDYSADMIKFTDGETFQQKYDAGELVGPPGPQGVPGADGAPGAAGADGGYYTPAVDSSGNLTWTASKAGMPAVSGANIKGAAGQDGADATINGVNALTLQAGTNVTLNQSDSTVTINAKAPSVLAFSSNKTVATSTWSSNSTYTAYPYRASVAYAGVTADYFPDIVFNPNDADFGKLAPICETYAGGVYIYASEKPGATVNIVSASFIRAAT